jgi:hypothetical protein
MLFFAAAFNRPDLRCCARTVLRFIHPQCFFGAYLKALHGPAKKKCQHPSLQKKESRPS